MLVCVSVYLPYQILIAGSNLYETWYVYHGKWTHLNGVLHKSLTSVCVSECLSPIAARQQLDNDVTVATNTHEIMELLDMLFSTVSVLYQKTAVD
jgi:hypothetical protein